MLHNFNVFILSNIYCQTRYNHATSQKISMYHKFATINGCVYNVEIKFSQKVTANKHQILLQNSVTEVTLVGSLVALSHQNKSPLLELSLAGVSCAPILN